MRKIFEKDYSLPDKKSPLTVVRTKFTGSKQSAFYYAAFFCIPKDVPDGFGHDLEKEIAYWNTYDPTKLVIGTGTTPQNACKNLFARSRFMREFVLTGGAFLPNDGI